MRAPASVPRARHGRARALAAAILLFTTLPSNAAAAEPLAPLTPDELARLADGGDVVRPQTVDIEHKRYIGGLGYVVVAATPDAIARLVVDPEAMREILPRTELVRPAGTAAGDALFELYQGTSIVHARYTLRVRSEPEHDRMRFWLDRGRPHAIDDAWGFFRYEPIASASGPAVLVTFGILIDVGPGLVRALYEDRLRAMALTVPHRLREYVMRQRGLPSGS